MDEKDRTRNLSVTLGQIEKQFGKGSILRLGAKDAIVPVSTISTGSISVDWALGVGGLPRGRICEIYGPESSGKTTIALQVVGQAQKAGGMAAFIDVEHALDSAGLDIARLDRADHLLGVATEPRPATALARGKSSTCRTSSSSLTSRAGKSVTVDALRRSMSRATAAAGRRVPGAGRRCARRPATARCCPSAGLVAGPGAAPLRYPPGCSRHASATCSARAPRPAIAAARLRSGGSR